MGVVIPTGCVSFMTREQWSCARFHQLNCKEEKTPSALEMGGWQGRYQRDKGASACLNIRESRRGKVVPTAEVLPESKNGFFSPLMGIPVTNLKKQVLLP